MLDSLEPGLWLFVEHPGLDVPEMRAIGHKVYEDVATDCQGVTDMFTSPQAREAIERRGIRFVSYSDVLRRNRALIQHGNGASCWLESIALSTNRKRLGRSVVASLTGYDAGFYNPACWS